MRVLTKLAGSMLLGTCAVLGAFAVDNHRREVAFFEADTRRDQLMVGRAIANAVRKTWQHEGRAAAIELPHQLERHLGDMTVSAIDTTDPAAWSAVPAADRDHLSAMEVVDRRDAGAHRTLLPVAGPDGGPIVVVIDESLAEEGVFARASVWRNVSMAAGIVVVCAGLAFAGGFGWVGRPIRRLGESARRIGGGDLDAVVRVDGNDEFTMLARELDTMRQALLAARLTVARQTEERLHALEQLRHADRLATVGRLAAGVAHELGTPLNVVAETAKMIGRGELTGVDLGEGVAMIVDQSARMTTIIRQLLDFARPRQPVRVRTDVAALCRRCLLLVEQLARKRGVAIDVSHADGDPFAEVDTLQLEQVMTNLMVNAIQATAAAGRVEVRVRRVVAQRPGDVNAAPGPWLRVDVVDNGCGIDPDNLARVFEPFFTTKGVGEGTGLGLSVSRGIVHENGGFFEVTSRKGEGSSFSVFLPAPASEGSRDR